ncbi:glycosyltransferase family 4 protein [Paenibacillus septentrionalis]|uniref:Glycosyltransferase family 4 protein n=1 Tax=Paenibacillus septentrionalis TaxID=429342 RepID=A0ABW1V8J2_9BACL
MKVWIVTNAYLPEHGGLVSYTRNLAKEILKQGINVEIITSNLKNRDLAPVEIIEGIKVTRIDYSNIPIFLKPFTPFIFYRKTLKFFQKYSIEENDIVISRFYTFALAVAKSKNIKKHIFISPLIASKLQHIEAQKVKGLKKIYYYLLLPQIHYLDKLAIKSTPYLGVLSHSKKDEITEGFNITNTEVNVIPPGVDIERFNVATSDEKKALRLKYEYNESDKILLCVSRLSSEKNIEMLVDVMNKIITEDKDVKLAIVGEGEARNRIENIIAKYKLHNNVKLWGARNNIEEFYKMADVFALLSKYEGFGHVYIEALACGLPCIAVESNPPDTVTASAEIITNNLLGVLVNCNKEEEVINAVKYCFENAEVNKGYRRDYVEGNFTWMQHFKNIREVFTEESD